MLESVADHEKWGRYTFLGYQPTLELTCRDGVMKVGDLTFPTNDPGRYIKQVLDEHKSIRIDGFPPFTGGQVGYFSYDYLKYAEPTLHLDPRIKAVGVFVNETKENILSLCRSGVIDCIQLHGNESDDLLRELQSETACPVIRAFRIETAADIQSASQSPADFVLLDHGVGGTGEAFDWSLA